MDLVFPYIKVRCAPNGIARFFGRGPNGVAPIRAGAGGRKKAFHAASGAASSYWRTYLGNVCRSKSLAEFEPMCSALWNTLGHAMERPRYVQSGEVTSLAPTT